MTFHVPEAAVALPTTCVFGYAWNEAEQRHVRCTRPYGHDGACMPEGYASGVDCEAGDVSAASATSSRS